MLRLTAVGLLMLVGSTAAASCGSFTNMFADMHDGDVKNVTVSEDGFLVISQNIPRWTLKVPLDLKTCSATVDFSKSNKPSHPPVPLRVALKQTSVGTMLIEFTDPSGTLNKDPKYPLNIWTTEREMPAADKCATFTDAAFQDMHDGDVKFVSLNAAGSLHMGQPGIWNLTTPLDLHACKAMVDFSKTAKPGYPPVPLSVSVSVASGSDGKTSVIMTWTDPSATISKSAGYPLNVWEDVKVDSRAIDAAPAAAAPSSNKDSPTTPHLYFYWKNADFNRCGDVDAAPRMPAALFQPENKAALQAYINVTIDLFHIAVPDARDRLQLSEGTCKDNDYSTLLPGCPQRKPNCNYPNPVTAEWAPVAMMTVICDLKCRCRYPDCKDVPDDPNTNHWCSLCGPKYNAPINVTLYNPSP